MISISDLTTKLEKKVNDKAVWACFSKILDAKFPGKTNLTKSAITKYMTMDRQALIRTIIIQTMVELYKKYETVLNAFHDECVVNGIVSIFKHETKLFSIDAIQTWFASLVEQLERGTPVDESTFLASFPVDEIDQEVCNYLRQHTRLAEVREDLPQQPLLRRLDILAMLLCPSADSGCLALAYDQTNHWFIIGANVRKLDSMVVSSVRQTIMLRLCQIADWLEVFKGKVDASANKPARIEALRACLHANDESVKTFIGSGVSIEPEASHAQYTSQHHLNRIVTKLAKVLDMFLHASDYFGHYEAFPFKQPGPVLRQAKIFLPEPGNLLLSRFQLLGDQDARRTPSTTPDANSGLIPCHVRAVHAEQLVMAYFRGFPPPQEMGLSKLLCHDCDAVQRRYFPSLMVSGTSHEEFPDVPDLLTPAGCSDLVRGKGAIPCLEREHSDGYSSAEEERARPRAPVEPDRETSQLDERSPSVRLDRSMRSLPSHLSATRLSSVAGEASSAPSPMMDTPTKRPGYDYVTHSPSTLTLLHFFAASNTPKRAASTPTLGAAFSPESGAR